MIVSPVMPHFHVLILLLIYFYTYLHKLTPRKQQAGTPPVWFQYIDTVDVDMCPDVCSQMNGGSEALRTHHTHV